VWKGVEIGCVAGGGAGGIVPCVAHFRVWFFIAAETSCSISFSKGEGAVLLHFLKLFNFQFNYILLSSHFKKLNNNLNQQELGG